MQKIYIVWEHLNDVQHNKRISNIYKSKQQANNAAESLKRCIDCYDYTVETTRLF